MSPKEQLIRHEGVRLQVYDDATGVTLQPGDYLRGWPSIGVGRNLTGKGITEEEAMYLLNNDLTTCYRDMWKYQWFRKILHVRQDAIINMRFNLGLNGLLNFRRMIAALDVGDYQAAAGEMLDSKWARQVGKRAEELAQQLLTGVEAA